MIFIGGDVLVFCPCSYKPAQPSILHRLLPAPAVERCGEVWEVGEALGGWRLEGLRPPLLLFFGYRLCSGSPLRSLSGAVAEGHGNIDVWRGGGGVGVGAGASP